MEAPIHTTPLSDTRCTRQFTQHINTTFGGGKPFAATDLFPRAFAFSVLLRDVVGQLALAEVLVTVGR